MWDIFQVLIKRAFCKLDLRAQKEHKVELDTPLGPWYQTTRHLEYGQYMTRNTLCWRQETLGPSMFNRYKVFGQSNYFVADGERSGIPKEALPAEIIEISSGKFQPKWQYSITINAERAEESRPDEDKEQLQKDGLEVLRKAPVLISCSDGSYEPIAQKAAFNWRIVTAKEED
jgi:hypothetical protein